MKNGARNGKHKRRKIAVSVGVEPSSVSPTNSPTLPMPPLVPQANGKGALYVGGIPGNAGGGRPKSAIRAAARQAWDERIPVLTAIADGEPVVKVKIKGKEGAESETEMKVSADPADRIRAMDALGRVGFGEDGKIGAAVGAEVADGSVRFTLILGERRDDE